MTLRYLRWLARWHPSAMGRPLSWWDRNVLGDGDWRDAQAGLLVLWRVGYC